MTFSERMRDMAKKSAEVSRQALSKAAAQAQVWGEMGVLKVEIIQYRNQAEKLTAQLGAEVYEAFGEKGQASVAADAPAVRDLVERIRELEKLVAGKEERFRKLGGAETDLEQAD